MTMRDPYFYNCSNCGTLHVDLVAMMNKELIKWAVEIDSTNVNYPKINNAAIDYYVKMSTAVEWSLRELPPGTKRWRPGW